MRYFLRSGLAASLLTGVFSASAASAADMPAYRAPPPAPVWSWTGIYVGGHLGIGSGYKRWSDPFPPPVFGDHVEMSGALAGGQIGLNYQIGAMVWGIETDASWARLEGSNTCFAAIGGVNCAARVDSLGTITGRLGLAAGRTLLYAKGGGAWAHDRYELNMTAFGLGVPAVAQTRGGWTIGAGVEHALSPNWTVKLEYNYLDFGSKSVNFPLPAPLTSVNIDQQLHVAKLGVNYKMDWGGPVYAKY